MFSHNAPRLNTWILGLGYLDRCIIRFFANCNEIGSIVTLLASRTSFLLFCPQIDPSINPLPLRPFSPFSHQNRITIRLPMLRTNRRFSSDRVEMPRCSNAIKPMFWVNFGKIMLQTKIRRVGAQKPNACPAIRFCDCNILVRSARRGNPKPQKGETGIKPPKSDFSPETTTQNHGSFCRLGRTRRTEHVQGNYNLRLYLEFNTLAKTGDWLDHVLGKPQPFASEHPHNQTGLGRCCSFPTQTRRNQAA